LANLVINITGKDGSKQAFASVKEGALILKAAQIQATQALTQSREELVKLKQAQTESTQATVRLKDATVSHQQSQDANARAMTAHRIQMDLAKLSSSNLANEVDKGSKANKDFEDAASGMSAHSIISFGLLEEAGRKVMDSIIAIGEKSVDLGKDVISAAGDYQENMNKLQFLTAQTGDSAETVAARMADFNKAAIQVGKDSTFSSKEATAAMADLAQMGYKTGEVTRIIGDAANAAMINNEGLTQATETLTSTLHGFGKTSDQSKQVLDTMTRASQLGKISFDDFGKAAENVGLVSVSTGQAFEGTTAELIALTNTGMSAERSSQTLRFALTQIEKPSKAASETLAALGLSYYDSQGHMKQYADIVDMVNKRTAGMTDEQKQQITTTLFSKNGVMAYNAALNAQATEVLPNGTTQILRGTDALRYNQKQLEESSGTMKKATDIMKDGFNFQMKNLQGSIEEAMISVGNTLLPGLTSIISLVKDNVNKFIDWEQKTHTIGNALVAIGKTIGTVVVGAFNLLSPIITNFVSLLSNHVTPAFSTLVIYFQQTILPLWIKIGSLILEIVVPAIKTIGDIIQKLIPTLAQFADFIYKNVLPPLLNLADVIIKTVLPPLLQFGQWLFTVLLPQVIVVAETLWKALQPAFSVIIDVIKTLMPIISQMALFIEGNLMRILRSLVDNFNKYVAPAIANLATFIKEKVIPAITDMWKWFQEKIMPVISQLVELVTKTLIPVLAQWIGFIIDHIIPILWQWWTIIATALKPIIEAIVNVISTYLIPAFKTIGDWIAKDGIPMASKLADTFQNNVLPVIKGVADFLGGAFALALNVPITMFGVIINSVKFMASVISSFVGFELSVLINTFKFLGDIVGTVVGGAFTGLNWVLNNVVVPAFGFIGTIIGNVVGFIKSAINAIANFFVDAINTPLNLINGIIDMLKNAPVIGGFFSGVSHLPTLQHVQLFANGTNSAPGGPAIVGEAGPELINTFGKIFAVQSPTLLANLPRGSQVIPVGGGANNGAGFSTSNSSTTNTNQKSETHNHFYNINANYKYQEHDSLVNDVRRLQMLNSRT
jgi:TP901 family phage tail tape measure protein